MKPSQYVLWFIVICVSQYQSGPVPTDELVINININDKGEEAVGLKHTAKQHDNGTDNEEDSDDYGGGKVKNYSGYKVLRITAHNQAELDTLQALQRNLSDSSFVDWWSKTALVGNPVMATVPPDLVHPVMAILQALGLTVNVTIQDLDKVIEEETKYRNASISTKGGWNPGIYHNLEEIQSRVKELLNEHPTVLSMAVIGKTYEGRNIEVVKVEKKGDNRPVIWIDCGSHAREWLSHATCLNILDKLVTDKDNKDKKVNMLAMFDFNILPVANPDGYAFSWASDRFWRKNRSPNKGGRRSGRGSAKCTHGVDFNRNFDVHFGEESSNNPCEEDYHGPAPFSEAETKAYKTGMEALQQKYGKERVVAYMSMHAFSQALMGPYGYTLKNAKDYDVLMDVMKESVTALKAVYGTDYLYGPSSKVMYLATGGSKDWAYDRMGIKYAFVMELRDKGEMGFLLPQEQIEPTATETWEGLKTMYIHIAKELGLLPPFN